MMNSFLETVPKNVSAREIMATKLVTLSPEMDVFAGIEVLVKHKISGAPVIDSESRLLGIFSEKSVMKVLVDAAYDQLPTNRVDAFMDTEPHTINETTQLISMAQIFLTTPRRRLPVIRDGILVGQVSRRDVVKAALNVVKAENNFEQRLLYLSALRAMSDAPPV